MISLNTFKKRIDELGRIVIPKEIRKLYKINNYDELEIDTIDNKIVITKSIGINEYKDKIKKYIDFIKTICNIDIIIFSNNNIIETTYDELNGNVDINLNDEYNNINQNIIINDIEILGYMYLEKRIIDSNFLGNILFIKKESILDINIVKSIKYILIDIIN